LNFTFQPSIDKHQIEELAIMRLSRTRKMLYSLGPLGVGKIHLATVLGIEAERHRYSTYYINSHALIKQLKKAHFENHLLEKLKVLSKY
jgi:DNA replication protein DnaC